jgi:hypothetical protein
VSSGDPSRATLPSSTLLLLLLLLLLRLPPTLIGSTRVWLSPCRIPSNTVATSRGVGGSVSSGDPSSATHSTQSSSLLLPPLPPLPPLPLLLLLLLLLSPTLGSTGSMRV